MQQNTEADHFSEIDFTGKFAKAPQLGMSARISP
jgi:hypothetical protein